ncbi:MAG: 2OG-Fe dioxygenase family protein [Polyangiales bacterium]
MLDKLQEAVRSRGFAFATGDEFRPLVDAGAAVSQAERAAFARSWATMPPDPYLARKGMARRRRHAVFEAEGSEVRPMPPRPHYQTIDYNPLQGGFPRHLAAIDAEVIQSPALRQLIAFGSDFFASVRRRPTRWDIEAHQFRIEASDGGEGLPTPEGRHRDGVDFVLVVLMQRVNLKSGTTSTHSDDGEELGAFTLTTPYDVALVDDRRVLHGVTPVSRLDPKNPGFRDVLVLTYRQPAPATDVAPKT